LKNIYLSFRVFIILTTIFLGVVNSPSSLGTIVSAADISEVVSNIREYGVINRVQSQKSLALSVNSEASYEDNNIQNIPSSEWQWHDPVPQGNTLRDIWCNSTNNILAVGECGTILYSDGNNWVFMDSDVNYDLWSVWGSSNIDVFAVGGGSTILHFDGISWDLMDSNIEYDSPGFLYGVWGSSSSDVFAVGSSYSGKNVILHYDGSIWSLMDTGFENVGSLMGIWGTSSNDVFVVGGHNILHYDGASWSLMNCDTTVYFHSIWGSGASDVYALGQGSIFHYNGITWDLMYSDANNGLANIWGISSSEIFVVDGYGNILHYDGISWSRIYSGDNYDSRTGFGGLTGIHGSSGSDVFAIGWGIILHYDGIKWNQLSSGVAHNINDVWGTSSSNVFAVGNNGIILRYDGNHWSIMDSVIRYDLNSVWGSSYNNVWAVGEQGAILHYDGTSWGVYTWYGMYTEFLSVWGTSASDVFFVGCNYWSGANFVLHYDGKNLKVFLSHKRTLYSIWGRSGSDVFVVGARGTILHYDGSTWTSMDSNSGDYCTLLSIWGSSGGNIFATGYYDSTDINKSLILHFDGSTWSPMNGGYKDVYLYEIWGNSGSDVFAVGIDENTYHGIILHYDGQNWIFMNSSIKYKGLRGIWGNSNNDVFAVGYNGILHYGQKQTNLPLWITSIIPNHGIQGQILTEVQINGTNLFEATSLTFSGTGVTASNLSVNDAGTQLTADITIASDAAIGPRDVTITTPVGTSVVLTGGFTVNVPITNLGFSIKSAQMISNKVLEIRAEVFLSSWVPSIPTLYTRFELNLADSNGGSIKQITSDTKTVLPTKYSPWLGDSCRQEITFLVDFDQEGVPKFEDNVWINITGSLSDSQDFSTTITNCSYAKPLPLPVIIIHGFPAGGADAYGIWHVDEKTAIQNANVAYEDLASRLKQAGYQDEGPHITLWWPGPTTGNEQDPGYWHNNLRYNARELTPSMAGGDKWVGKYVDDWVNNALEHSWAEKVNFAGHSTGGLLARYYAGLYIDATGQMTEQVTGKRNNKVKTIITVGTPHRGVTEFYRQALQKATRSEAEQLGKVAGTNLDNLMFWFEPEYTESSLITNYLIPHQTQITEPFDNTFPLTEPNPAVTYHSLYTNQLPTPYQIQVELASTIYPWYIYNPVLYNVDNYSPDDGDGFILEQSASYDEGGWQPSFVDSNKLEHGDLCKSPNFIKKITSLLLEQDVSTADKSSLTTLKGSVFSSTETTTIKYLLDPQTQGTAYKYMDVTLNWPGSDLTPEPVSAKQYDFSAQSENGTAAAVSSDLDLVLLDPAGREITAQTTDAEITHNNGNLFESYQIINPPAGEWSLKVIPVNVSTNGEPFVIDISLYDNLLPIAENSRLLCD
jgi:pimeloyl-ACP methyl ester carboxylesterase